jgi:ATP:ADP antiporter, AAA family
MLNARISKLLGVEAGEGRAVGLMAALYFVLAVSFVFVQTTAFGLFIGEYGPRNLPFAYLSVALLASAIAYLYLWLLERLAFRAVLFVNLGFLAGVSVVFWLGLRSHLAHLFIFFLPFWFQALLNLANLLVWPLAGRMFDVRQAKRLYGLVGAGNWTANILGGLVIASILSYSGTSNPYLFAAIAIIAAGFVLWTIFRFHLVPEAAPQAALPSTAPRDKPKPASSPFHSPYNRLIFAKVALWWIGFYFVDNIFLDRAGAQFHSGAEVAAFIGRQLSVVGVIAIITSTFLTGRIIRRFGVRTGLLVMPIVVTFCTLLLVIGGVFHAPAILLFWIAAAAKTFNLALGFSVSQASATLLYQPILGDERNRTQTIAEGIVQPAAIGLAGLLLLLFNTTLHLDAVGLSAIFLPIAAVWLWIIYRVSAKYPQVLSEALVKRSLGDSTSLLLDPAGIAQLQVGLKSPRAQVVLYALNQLEQSAPDAWQTWIRPAVPDLLAHPAAEVRRYVLQRLLALGPGDAVADVRRRLDQEPDLEAKALAVQLLAAFDAEASGKQLAQALSSDQRLVRQGALTGLLMSARPSQIQKAIINLETLVGSSDAQDRQIAAEVLASAACPDSDRYIAALLVDSVPAVRHAALRAAGRQDAPALLDGILAACSSPETAGLAEQVLISKGKAALPAVLAAFGQASKDRAASELHSSLMRVLLGIGGEEAQAALLSQMDSEQAGVRSQAMLALSELGYRARLSSDLAGRVKSELAEAAWIVAAIRALVSGRATSGMGPLRSALESAFVEARRRVLLLLSFALDVNTMLRAAQALDGKSAAPLAFALEAVDATLPARLKPTLLPLIEDLSPAERLARWTAAGIQTPSETIEDAIQALIAPGCVERFSRWVYLCAIHAAGVLGAQAVVPVLQSLGSSTDLSIARMSQWSLKRLLSDRSTQGGVEMLSLVEKALALKSASLFNQTPDNVLADIAERVQEVSYGKDDVIFKKGDFGNSLYIIVSGRVEVRNADRLLNDLGEGAIFGELALLDPAPRSATVKAMEPTHLLMLDESHFHAILAERPEVSTAIIRVLTGYLRTHLRNAEEIVSGDQSAHE